MQWDGIFYIPLIKWVESMGFKQCMNILQNWSHKRGGLIKQVVANKKQCQYIMWLISMLTDYNESTIPNMDITII